MLTNKVSLIVPGTDHGKPATEATIAGAVQSVMTAFSKLFGGATAIKGEGAWVSDATGKLIVEPITIVYAFCDVVKRAEVVALAQNIAVLMGQECVSVEWPEGMDFIKADAQAQAA
jgi:hypothetical protein